MNNDIISANPYSKMLPESTNDIIRFSSPQAIHQAYNLNLVHGCFNRTKNDKIPEYVRKFAQYNYDALKANQEDGQDIIFENTREYNSIKGISKGQYKKHYINHFK